MRVNTAQQQAALMWDQSVMDYKEAVKSVKSEEGGMVKGAAAGVASSVVRGAVAIPALARAAMSDSYTLEDAAQLDKDTKNLMGDALIDPTAPGEATGFDAGNVLGDVAQAVLPTGGTAVAAAGAVGKVEKYDELTELAIEQAQSLLLNLRKGGGEPSKIREALAGLGSYLESKGVDIKKLQPEKVGERNDTAMPVKPKDKEYNSEGELIRGDKNAAQKHSQGQHDPKATAGLSPQGPAPSGFTWENSGNYAVRVQKHWQKGFDPEQFVAHKLSSLKTAARDASKTDNANQPPQFWVYDESANKVLVVRRDKKGNLVVGEPTGPGAKAINPFKDEKGPNGEQLLRDEIDVVVKDHGYERLRNEIYKQTLERLDTK